MAMSRNTLGARTQQVLSLADVRINGDRPWDITVRDARFYARVLRQGSLGLGESYMDGWWDCEALDQFFCQILSAGLDLREMLNWNRVMAHLKTHLFNRQTKSRVAAAVGGHYDLGNELYQAMLDRRMVYTSAYWEGASNLDEAQEAKLEFVCRQLDLKPGMRILDIGCGWGSFAKYAAERHGVEVVGITVSKEQVELGQQLCRGLPVEIRLQDYRDVREPYDHVVSLGMFEHVGYKNYPTFMKAVHGCLPKGGLFYLETIGSNRSLHFNDAWYEKYIFPASMLPSVEQIGAAIEGFFVPEKWLNWAAHYDQTLLAWFGNFHAHWDRLKARYGERFYRMWRYYLLSSAGAFRARKTQVWQIVLFPLRARGG